MKDLEKYSRGKREALDDMEPAFGHFQRFEALLDKQGDLKTKHVSKRVNLISVFAVAASIAILALIGIKFYTPQHIDTNNIIKEHSVSAEFYTTNEYYNKQMQEQIADIMCKVAYLDTNSQAQLQADIQRIMESNAAFVGDISRNENQEIAIHFLIKHYKTNIQTLENLNEKLGKFTTKC